MVARLHGHDGDTKTGVTRCTVVLTPCEYLPPEELPDEEFPFYLTTRALDPIAKIPEYKVCAVRVEAVD